MPSLQRVMQNAYSVQAKTHVPGAYNFVFGFFLYKKIQNRVTRERRSMWKTQSMLTASSLSRKELSRDYSFFYILEILQAKEAASSPQRWQFQEKVTDPPQGGFNLTENTKEPKNLYHLVSLSSFQRFLPVLSAQTYYSQIVFKIYNTNAGDDNG